MTTNKTKIIGIALFLVLTVSGIMMSMAASKAQTATSFAPTNAYITVSPNPVGVNQQVTLVMWLVQVNPTVYVEMGGRWENYTVLITKPDGTSVNLGPFTADPSSAAHAFYTPDMEGTYTIKFSFPGQRVEGFTLMRQPINVTYDPSSWTTTFTVQQDPVTPSPQTPLPTEYWSRPINSQNQEWYTISGNWLATGAWVSGLANYNGTGNFNPYTTAPNSAHIVWTKPLQFGGLIGGEFGGTATSVYYEGKTYEPVFAPPVIMNGVLYYNNPPNQKQAGFYAVDLRTGETLWQQNTTFITNGQVYNYKSPNQIGGIPYLWYMMGPKWYMYDAVTGNLILTIENVSDPRMRRIWMGNGGCMVEGPNGELLVYVLDTNWLAMWNSSRCIGTAPGNVWEWRPQAGATLDWQNGIQWNVTSSGLYPGQVTWMVNEGVLLANTGGLFVGASPWQIEVCYNATTGEEMWVQNRTLNYYTNFWGFMGTISEGVITEFDTTTMQWNSYSIYTGEKIWGPSEAYTNAWGSIAEMIVHATSAYGNQYSFSLDGCHVLNITSGEKLWDFYADPSGINFPGFTTYPFGTDNTNTIADGKIFATTGGSHGNPQFRGCELYAINASSGQKVWEINGFFQNSMPVADGYLVAFNGYDNQIYAFSKGPSKTTVTAPDIGVTTGTSVMIRGTVTDISAGSQQNEVAMNFPNGLPCVSDDSMSDWMEYVYMQQAKPTKATGVEVFIKIQDPNGDWYSTYVTTDENGVFSHMWSPSVVGEYHVTTMFEGSESYYTSEATTTFGVDSVPETTGTDSTDLTSLEDSISNLMTYILATLVVGILALLIAVYLLLKSRQ